MRDEAKAEDLKAKGITASSPIRFVTDSHIGTENIIKKSGMGYTIFRNNLYLDMVPIFLGQKVLEMGGPTGETKAAFAMRDGMAEATAAFNHDISNLKQASEDDRKVIETLGAVLAGSDRPFLIDSGTGLARSKTGAPVVETDGHVTSAEFPRAATEEAADTLAAKGMRVILMRNPQVHDTRHQDRIAHHILLARQKGWVAYVGEGKNRLPAVHVSDAAQLYRLALEKGEAGKRYHAVAECFRRF